MAAAHGYDDGEALVRADAYAAAGADGVFAPGVTDDVLIAELCRRSSRPVNVMMGGPLTSVRQVAGPGATKEVGSGWA